jgi:DNA-binding MarR family transcriptional regulator
VKPAEGRLLAFCASKAKTLDCWFEVSQRQITAECRISSRDVTPTLDRLAKRGLILLKVNHYYRAMQRTEVAFLVDVKTL